MNGKKGEDYCNLDSKVTKVVFLNNKIKHIECFFIKINLVVFNFEILNNPIIPIIEMTLIFETKTMSISEISNIPQTSSHIWNHQNQENSSHKKRQHNIDANKWVNLEIPFRIVCLEPQVGPFTITKMNFSPFPATSSFRQLPVVHRVNILSR